MLRLKSFLVAFLLVSSISMISNQNTTLAIKDVNILCFIENDFGGSYYINKGFLEGYGYTVITASSTSSIIGCKNGDKNITDTEADVLLENILDGDLARYDCIFVPSGGHWLNMIFLNRTLELIHIANAFGILVAGICTGMIVLAHSLILENVTVASNPHASDWLNIAGAFMIADTVVSDQGIITGGFGGGIGVGPQDAPNEEFCEKIKEEIEIANKASFAFGIFLGPLIIASYVSLLRKKRS